MTREEIIHLCDRIATGQASEQDLVTYNSLLDQFGQSGWTDARMGEREEVRAAIKSAIDAALIKSEAPARGKLFRFRHSWWAAAAVLVIAAGGVLYYRGQHPATPPPVAAQQDIKAPTGSRTTLTLGNGRQIILDSVPAGTLAAQGGTTVAKRDSSALSYQPTAGAAPDAAVLFNTLTTAPGGQTRVVLADGSQVWLNTASSLRYPTAFNGADRTVDLKGEAYFEIAPHPARPFFVHVNGSTVAVLGTHFNIMAYTDEAGQQLTLLEGSVRVTKGTAVRVLHPGEQAVVDNGSGQLSVNKDVDEEAVLAWKNGFFEFNGQDIQAVMRQVSRWYNVRVVYDGTPPAGHFFGEVNRTSQVSDVLKIFAKANIRYTISNDQITILH
jgi:transmembrane sensor